MSDAIQQFKNALNDAGVILAANSQILADGKLHRAKTTSDKGGQCSAWYRLHLDAPVAGAGGDWRQGIKLTWTSKRQSSLSSAERAALAIRISRERAEAEAELEARHKQAAERALKVWTDAAPASAGHPYLVKKGIAAGIARQSGDSLILPVLDFGGALRGLQFISEDGSKRFISGMAKQGAFIPTGTRPDGTLPLWIAEGWATACTLQSLKPDVCVIAALDCGNLRSVGMAARKHWPRLEIVIASDFDAVGQAKGREAAQAARAKILPVPAEVPENCTDWNDYHQWRKSQGVRS